MNKPGDAWRVHMAGVGGMGIGVVNAILVRAGHKEGYRVVFPDKKGLAIRNGGVYSQITFVQASGRRGTGSRPRRTEAPHDASAGIAHRHFYPTTGTIPYGKADLLLGIDILEAARAIDPREQFRVASPDRTCAVLNMHKQPTVYTLLGKEDFDPEELREEIYEHCRAGAFVRARISRELCEQRLGTKLYVEHHDARRGVSARADPGVGAAASPGRSRTRSAASTARTSRRSTSAASSRWSRGRCRASPSRRRGSSWSPTRAASSARRACSGRRWR